MIHMLIKRVKLPVYSLIGVPVYSLIVAGPHSLVLSSVIFKPFGAILDSKEGLSITAAYVGFLVK